ncbi:hypothetical protein SUDANB178_07789 (plasmid) [Streptomyces sp. enrichment culture]
MSVPCLERSSTRPPVCAASWARKPSHFGSAAHPAGRAGLSTATVSIGSGKDQVTGDAFPVGCRSTVSTSPVTHQPAGSRLRLLEEAEGGVGPAVDAGRDVLE